MCRTIVHVYDQCPHVELAPGPRCMGSIFHAATLESWTRNTHVPGQEEIDMLFENLQDCRNDTRVAPMTERKRGLCWRCRERVAAGPGGGGSGGGPYGGDAAAVAAAAETTGAGN